MDDERSARFVCAIAAALPDGEMLTTRGTIEGRIGYEIIGDGGFGYDPILYLPERGLTTAQIGYGFTGCCFGGVLLTMLIRKYGEKTSAFAVMTALAVVFACADFGFHGAGFWLMLAMLTLLDDKGMLHQVQVIDLSDAALITMRYMDRFDVEFLWDADFDYKLDYLAAVVDKLEANEKGTIDMTQEGKASFIPA